MFRRFIFLNYHYGSGLQHWLRPRFTRGGVLALIGLVFMASRADTNLSVGYQAFSFLFWVVAAALFANLLSRVRVRADRLMPRLASAGVPLTYRIIVHNQGSRTLKDLAVMENLADPRPSREQFLNLREPGEEKRNWFDRTYGYYRWEWLVERAQKVKTNEQPLPILPATGRVEIAMRLEPLRRGVVHFKGASIACPDLLGLFRRMVEVPLPQSLLILPKRYPVPPIALPGTMRYQPGGVTLASSVGESEEFIALRDYRPGDPMRHIHWRSWAKMGKPIVKEFQDEFFVRHALVLDTFGDANLNGIFEEAVSLAASFACAVQTQDSLLDLLFVGPKAYCFTVGRGVAHIDQMLEILASVDLCPNQSFSALHQLVIDHSTAISGCLCVFIAWDEPRRKLVEHLQAQKIPLMVFVVEESGSEDKLDPGPLRDCPEAFHALERSKIGEGLARL